MLLSKKKFKIVMHLSKIKRAVKESSITFSHQINGKGLKVNFGHQNFSRQKHVEETDNPKMDITR